MSPDKQATTVYQNVIYTWTTLLMTYVWCPIWFGYQVIAKHRDVLAPYSTWETVQLAFWTLSLLSLPFYLHSLLMKTNVTMPYPGRLSMVLSYPFKNLGWQGSVSDVQTIAVAKVKSKFSFLNHLVLIMADGKEIPLKAFWKQSTALEEANAIAKSMGLDSNRVSVGTTHLNTQRGYRAMKKALTVI
jgi:hypothetical protein